MSEAVFPRDRALSIVSMAIGVLIWVVAVGVLVHLAGAMAIAGIAVTLVAVALMSFLAYLFVKSAVIAHLRGNAIEVTEHQLPDLFAQLTACCKTLQLDRVPTMYIQNGNGVLNAFATWFMGHKYVVLLSSIVDAMAGSPNGVRFYIGHELGHILRHDNPVTGFLRWPALRLPLLGAAFSRARESTCDLHGLACSVSPEGATRSVTALSAGARAWSAVSLDGYRQQLASTSGFWMSFHELIASYPWTVKRAMRVLDKSQEIPRRNPFAYLLAIFVPYSGRMGAGFGVLLYVYVVGVLAAIAIPAYKDYTARAIFQGAAQASVPARMKLVEYYQAEKKIPPSLASVGVDADLPNGMQMSMNPRGMVVTIHTRAGDLVFTPRSNQQGEITWVCGGGEGVRPQQLPLGCR